MRVADKMTFAQVNNNLSKNRAEMNDLQNQAATQKKINKPSDDPLGTARVMGAKSEENQQRQFLKSLNLAKGFLELTDQSLGELSEILMRAKELAVGQASDSSASEETRRVAATEIEQLINQSIQIGNRKLGDRYIFGGFKTTSAPFDRFGNYKGDKGEIQIQVNKDSYITMNIPGYQPFMGEESTDFGITEKRNQVPKNSDELIKNLETRENLKELEQENKNPFKVYSGQGRGLASVSSDERVEQFEDIKNELIENGEGEEYLLKDYKNKNVNVFDTLKSLSVSLRTNSKEGVQETLDILDQALNQVVETRAQVGARVMALNNDSESLQKSIMDNRVKASQIEDSDVFQLVSDINKTESALKATLETSGKLMQPSLLDFIK